MTDSTELQQGDRERIIQGQQVQRLSRTPSPNIRPAPAASPPSPGGGGGALPEYLFASPSNRPDEPMTEGLPFGPGAGPEVLTPEPVDAKQEILHKLYAEFGDDWALDMLNEMRAPQAAPVMAPEMAPEEVMEPEEPEPTELPYPETEPTEEPVETEGAVPEETAEEAPIEAVPADEGGDESAS